MVSTRAKSTSRVEMRLVSERTEDHLGAAGVATGAGRRSGDGARRVRTRHLRCLAVVPANSSLPPNDAKCSRRTPPAAEISGCAPSPGPCCREERSRSQARPTPRVCGRGVAEERGLTGRLPCCPNASATSLPRAPALFPPFSARGSKRKLRNCFLITPTSFESRPATPTCATRPDTRGSSPGA